jgi:hypothetical protein
MVRQTKCATELLLTTWPETRFYGSDAGENKLSGRPCSVPCEGGDSGLLPFDV